MRMTRALRKTALLALCLPLLAACAPEGNPVGVTALPGDPGAYALTVDPAGPESTPHDANNSLLECQVLQDGDSACAARCETE
jgi:hypothetical protein